MKKRGLILSSVVMVVVLIAALSTATFAWFSSQAQATIDNLSVATVATRGLEVAVKNSKDTYYSGLAAWDETNKTFTGDVNDFGIGVDFANITGEGTKLGQLDTAVTRLKDENTAWDGKTEVTGLVYSSIIPKTDNGYITEENKFTEQAVNDKLSYAIQEEGVNKMVMVEANSDAIAETKYYLPKSDAQAGDYLYPIGYNTVDGKLVPYAYAVAEENSHYLDLPISVRATIDVKYIICTITLTPNSGKMTGWESYAPGMAAATYLNISDGVNDVTLQPYSAVETGGTGFINYNSAPSFMFKFIVAMNGGTDGADANVKALEAIDYNYSIWIEGTDGQCINKTAGSAFDIKIDYSYVPTGGSTEYNESEASVDQDANGIAMGTVAIKGTLKYNGETYYNIGVTKDFKGNA